MPISRGNLSFFNRFPRLIDTFWRFLQDKCIFIQPVTSINCLIREKVVTFRMVKLNMLLSIFLITK